VLAFFLVPGVCGAVPLGVLIMSSTNMAIYTVSFALMKDAFGMQAFGTKGHPSVYMTDDCDAKRAALEDVAPARQPGVGCVMISIALTETTASR